tara:strand:+ start:606 stop:815 length:210 start_codon:yes stop_codon:yes gene_type:complete
MSIEPMRQSTNLYEQINEALKPIYLSQDELEELSNAVSSYEKEQIDESINLQNVLNRLEDIVLTPQEDV